MATLMIDYDEVVYPWAATAHLVCQNAGITNGRELTQWDLVANYGCSPDELDSALSKATRTGVLYNANPIPGAVPGLHRLCDEGHRLKIVTARGTGPHARHSALIEYWTLNHLRRFAVPYHQLIFTSDKGSVDADFAVDDAPHNCERIQRAGIPVAMMDSLHNQTEDRFPRVESLYAFADWVAKQQD